MDTEFVVDTPSPEPRKPMILFAILLVFVCSILTTLIYALWISPSENKSLELATQQKILALQVISNIPEAISAKPEAFIQLQDANEQIEKNITRLKHGGATLDVTETLDSISAESMATINQWKAFQNELNTILRAESVIRILNDFSININDITPGVIDGLNDVLDRLHNANAKSQHIIITSQLLVLAQTINTSAMTIIRGETGAKTASEFFEQKTKRFGELLTSLIHGNKNKTIKKITNRTIKNKLQAIKSTFSNVEQLVNRISEKAPQLIRAHQASKDIVLQSKTLLNSISLLKNSLTIQQEQHQKIIWSGLTLSGITFLIFIFLLIKYITQTPNTSIQKNPTTPYPPPPTATASGLSDKKTQQAIIKLLNDIETFAKGDLTVKATVDTEITGAIADAVNLAIHSLVKLVTAIDHMANQVAENAEETQVTTIHLARASDQQSEQIAQVTQSIESMAKAIRLVSEHAVKSSQVATKALNIAVAGSNTVKKTVASMITIQTDIKYFATQTKRLGESSHEIGDIVELIKDIADQTNILALNSAIQASTSNGKTDNPASIAEEVQQLADKVGLATHNIETLVHSIRTDTAKVVTAMEQTTSDVSNGTALAHSAGKALVRIEIISTELSALTKNISDAANQLSSTANKISRNMNTIKNVTNQNLAGTKQTVNLTGNLANHAKQLKELIKGFKLP